MLRILVITSLSLVLVACAANQNASSPSKPLSSVLEGMNEAKPSTTLNTPEPRMDHGLDERAVMQGRYLVDLLGCGSCHTDGAIAGRPNSDRLLAGSRTGIAYTNPMLSDYPPGVVYPPNLTPDDDTGLGRWSIADIAAFLRTGMDRHGSSAMLVMPWPVYARLQERDAVSIATYLKSLPPVVHQTPERVPEGKKATSPFVYFSIYTTDTE